MLGKRAIKLPKKSPYTIVSKFNCVELHIGYPDTQFGSWSSGLLQGSGLSNAAACLTQQRALMQQHRWHFPLSPTLSPLNAYVADVGLFLLRNERSKTVPCPRRAAEEEVAVQTRQEARNAVRGRAERRLTHLSGQCWSTDEEILTL